MGLDLKTDDLSLKTELVVRYTYYHYNTGSGDNGIRTREQRCMSVEAARGLAFRIEEAARSQGEKGDKALEEELGIDDEGYLTGLKGIFVRTIVEEELPLVG